MELKILLLGFGSIGRKHFYNLNFFDDIELDIYDKLETISPEILPHYARINQGDYKEITDFSYDLVIIATPTDTHVEAIKFFDGKVPYIMCEKPLAKNKVSLDVTSQIFVNHAYRFERGLIKLKESLRLVGTIRHVTMENSYSFEKLHPHYTWEQYDGIIYDDSHMVNTSRFLFGEPVEILSKMIRKDIAQWNWETELGVLVSHMTDTLNERYKKRIEVRGDFGTLIWNFRAHELFFAPSNESERIAIPYKKADHLQLALAYVLGIIRDKGTFKENTIEDAMKDMEVIECLNS